MAWVNIKGHRYYRRSRRVGGRVVTEHVGRGEFAEAMAGYDEALRESDRAERECDRFERRVGDHTFLDFFGLDDFLADVVAALARRQGWHRHKRQWRKRRRHAAPGTGELHRLTDELRADYDAGPPGSPGLAGVPEADCVLLAGAAAGDAAALAAAEPYFRDARRLTRWAGPVRAARRWLVGSRARTTNPLARVAHRSADSLEDGLGWSAADPLQRLAMLRVVNNWLAVGALEAKAGRCGPGRPARLQVERT